MLAVLCDPYTSGLIGVAEEDYPNAIELMLNNSKKTQYLMIHVVLNNQ